MFSLRTRVGAQYTVAVRPTIRLPRLTLGPYLKRDLIQQTAYLVLVFRIVEGLAAWVLFNEVFLPAAPDAWPIHFVFLAYFVVNSFFCLRYRAGRITTALVLVDVVINLGTMTLAAGCTGGVTSPVVLISLFKIAGYGFVFTPRAGLLAVGVMLIGSLVLALAEAGGAVERRFSAVIAGGGTPDRVRLPTRRARYHLRGSHLAVQSDCREGKAGRGRGSARARGGRARARGGECRRRVAGRQRGRQPTHQSGRHPEQGR